ncbi:hypothetical protein KTQ42_19295 [Noviherbaspirillum sp. L7-7A]|uniref:hypothetical protein n=1 Tax=Noviherbaspirillum sp. L7-7A TaxID=2850560 RepID=UPI001C2BA048|nr:hypothetical protein [Noviherbaspirillum sp. L7-7A]MBV0881442.1 hypothetical protein [Noviherbaspirillum sp. L7-7A]
MKEIIFAEKEKKEGESNNAGLLPQGTSAHRAAVFSVRLERRKRNAARSTANALREPPAGCHAYQVLRTSLILVT